MQCVQLTHSSGWQIYNGSMEQSVAERKSYFLRSKIGVLFVVVTAVLVASAPLARANGYYSYSPNYGVMPMHANAYYSNVYQPQYYGYGYSYQNYYPMNQYSFYPGSYSSSAYSNPYSINPFMGHNVYVNTGGMGSLYRPMMGYY
jgi:hypothetical protein